MHYDSSEFLKASDELKILNGCNVDFKLGSIVKELGYSQVGDLSSGNNITGLFNFRQSASTQKMLATTNNAGDTALELYYSTGGNWTEITAAETAWNTFEDAVVEMETMDGYCYFVGYDATDAVWLPVGSLTDTTFSTSTNVTNMPNAKYIKRYRDRIYIANCYINPTAYPYRVYYSTVPSSGSITWTVATNFLDVDYSEAITGLGENWDRLYIFTQFSTYGYNQTEFKKLWDIGCCNHRTIKNCGVYMLWCNFDGIQMSSGGRPVKISAKVDSFFKAGTPANYFAEIIEEEYHLYIGTVTVDDVTYTNTEIIYNIPHQTFRIRELSDNITAYAQYNNSGKMELWMGDASGEVHKRSKYSDATPVYADDGAAIKAQFQTWLLHFGEPQNRKLFKKIITYTEKAQGLKLQARVVDKNQLVLTKWFSLGELNKYVTEHTVKSDRGNFLQIQGRELSTNEAFIFDGFSVEVLRDSNA